MGWLLSGLVLLGLAVLVLVLVPLVGRLRRNRSAVSALRATLDEGSSQLRTGQDLVREWRAVRSLGRHRGPDA